MAYLRIPTTKVSAPCDTPLKATEAGFEVHLITLTHGEAGQHPDQLTDLGQAREAEWRAATFVYYRLKAANLPLARLCYYCYSEASLPSYNINWIYADKAHGADEIGETINARGYRGKITEVMQKHYTQRQDYGNILSRQGETLGSDYFIMQQ